MSVNLNDYKGRSNRGKECFFLPVLTTIPRGVGSDGKEKVDVVVPTPGHTGDLLHVIVDAYDAGTMDDFAFDFRRIGRDPSRNGYVVALPVDKKYDVVIINKDRSQRRATYSAEEIVSIGEAEYEEYLKEKADNQVKLSEEKDSGLGSSDKSEPKMGLMAKLRNALKAPKDKNATFNVNVEDNVSNERAKQVEGAFGDVADKAGTDLQASV